MSNTDTSKDAPKAAGFLQPHPGTSVMQMAITFCAAIIALTSVCVAAAAIVFVVKSGSDERNARLVEIGLAILRGDPQKEGHVDAARNWALDLIDANAGRVKFSPEARAELLKKPLETGWYDTGYEFSPQLPPPKSRPRAKYPP